jgi:hypothetical protein
MQRSPGTDYRIIWRVSYSFGGGRYDIWLDLIDQVPAFPRAAKT